MITDKIQLKQNISSSIYIFDSLCHHDLGFVSVRWFVVWVVLVVVVVVSWVFVE